MQSIVKFSVIGNWSVKSAIELLKTISSYTQTSSHALSVSEIYLLLFRQAQLRDSHLFYTLKSSDYIEWLTFTHCDELTDAKVKFIAWANLNRNNIEEKCLSLQLDLSKITLDDYWKAINLDNYKKQLMGIIAQLEDIPNKHAQKLEDRQRLIDETQKKRLEVIEFNKAKNLRDQEEQKKRDDEWIQQNINYYHRCQHYIRWGFDDNETIQDDSNTDIDIEEMKTAIREAHELKNKSLLEYKEFPGCHDFGIGCDCGNQNCYWMANMHRCSCDNYKGFTFETDNVDWLTDLTLGSTSPRGRQERQW